MEEKGDGEKKKRAFQWSPRVCVVVSVVFVAVVDDDDDDDDDDDPDMTVAK